MPRLLALLLLVFAAPLTAQEAAVIAPGSEALDLSLLNTGSRAYTITVFQGEMSQPFGTAEGALTVDEEAGTVENTMTIQMMGMKLDTRSVATYPGMTLVSTYGEDPQQTLDYTLSDGLITGTNTPNGGSAEAFEMSTDGPIFDGGWVSTFATLLPLAEGYSATIPAYSYAAGGLADYTLAVTGTESFGSEAKPAAVWTVEVTRPDGPVQTLYIDTETRALYRIAFEPQPGVVVHIDTVQEAASQGK